MISISPEAAKQIKASAEQGQTQGLPLRIAAKREDDGNIHYALGFADEEFEGDVHVIAGDIDIVTSKVSMAILENTEIDFVELDSGEKNFIFKNPNDPNYIPNN